MDKEPVIQGSGIETICTMRIVIMYLFALFICHNSFGDVVPGSIKALSDSAVVAEFSQRRKYELTKITYALDSIEILDTLSGLAPIEIEYCRRRFYYTHPSKGQ